MSARVFPYFVASPRSVAASSAIRPASIRESVAWDTPKAAAGCFWTMPPFAPASSRHAFTRWPISTCHFAASTPAARSGHEAARFRPGRGNVGSGRRTFFRLTGRNLHGPNGHRGSLIMQKMHVALSRRTGCQYHSPRRGSSGWALGPPPRSPFSRPGVQAELQAHDGADPTRDGPARPGAAGNPWRLRTGGPRSSTPGSSSPGTSKVPFESARRPCGSRSPMDVCPSGRWSQARRLKAWRRRTRPSGGGDGSS